MLFNQGAEKVFGYAATEVIGQSLDILLPQRFAAAHRGHIEDFSKSSEASRMMGQRREVFGRRKDGGEFPVELSLASWTRDGQPAFAAIIRDITQRKRSEERLTYLAQYDHLTGLVNRTLFRDRLIQAMARSKRLQQPLGLMLLDLDRFKAVNDTLGHDIGDELLKSVAERLKACVREVDTVARMGGDEFTIVLEGVSSEQSIIVVAKRIKYRRPIYAADRWHFHHRMTNIGFSQRRTLAYLYAWAAVMAGLALALRFVPYSDDRGNFDAIWTAVMAGCLLAALAASVYLVVVLEILKLAVIPLAEIYPSLAEQFVYGPSTTASHVANYDRPEEYLEALRAWMEERGL